MKDPDRILSGLDEHERARGARPALPERYELLSELGRGGMAVVWRARDRQLGREVAVKMLRDDLAVEPGDLERFRREAESIAKLSHPNVITVFDAGPTYLVMELVKGGSLESSRFSVELLEKVARAVHAAHEHGIVHRDLKPSNILLTEAGEPKVADFGIAHLAGKQTRLTQSGLVIGTPQYMAPEQAEGLALSARTDVYALGAILYEGLTGRTPHEGLTPMELLRKIVGEDPAPPRIVNPKLSRDIDTITLKALEKDPARRYASALEMADDLRRCREGAPIRARPASALYRLRKRLAKKVAVLVVAAIGLNALVVTLALTVPTIAEQRRALRLWSELSVILHDADTDMRAGDVRRANDRLDAGIRRCEAATGASARYFLGRFLRVRGRRAEAIDALTQALAMEPRLGEAHFERGLAYVEEYADALTRVQSAFAGRGPRSGPVKPPSGEALERLNADLAELRRRAIADLETRIDGASAYYKPVDADFGRAELERMRWNWDNARRDLLAVVAKEARYAQAHLGLARAARMVDDWDAAERHASDALKANLGLGAALAVRSDALFWKAESLGPGQEAGELRKRALADATAAIELGEPAFAIRANVRRRSGDVDGAIEDYDRALAIQPRDAVALNHRGVARMAKKLVAEAIADFDASIRISPGYAMAYYNRALAHLDREDVAAARRDAAEALRCSPPDAPYRGDVERLVEFMRNQ